MTDIHSNLFRLACFFNGYYEKKENKLEKRAMSSYCNDDVFCALFFQELKVLEHVDNSNRRDIPRHLDQDDLNTYMSLINQSYLYIVQECMDFTPYDSIHEDSIQIPCIEKIILKIFPDITYAEALKIIKEINAMTCYGYYEVHDYYRDDVYYHFKYIKIEELEHLLKGKIGK